MDDIIAQNEPVILNWSEITKWTYTSALLKFGDLPDGWSIYRVGDIVEQIDTKHRVIGTSDYEMAGVKWYGEGVFHRETVQGLEQSATYLQPLRPRCLIYNRLFAWKSSFAVVPEQFSNLFVSNEFPQFSTDINIILPEYLYLLMITSKFQAAVNAASIGSAAVSRNRFKESDFEDFIVPLPPLAIQSRIVEQWEDARKLVSSKQDASSVVVSELNNYLKNATDEFDSTVSSNNFVAFSAKTLQWDIKAGRSAAFIAANPDFVRLGDFTEECTETIRPWEAPEAEWPVYGVNNKEGVFLNSLQKGADFNAPYKSPFGKSGMSVSSDKKAAHGDVDHGG
jgi:hypothetical protein